LTAPAEQSASALLKADAETARDARTQAGPANSFVQNENAPAPQQQQQQLQQALNAYRAPGAPMASESPSVRYTILRKSDTGAFVEVKPDDLKAGEIVEIKFETNQSGFLTVISNSRPFASFPMRPFTAQTTRPMRADMTELQVTFAAGGVVGGMVSFQSMDRKQSAASPNSNLVQGERPGQQLKFTIRLNNKQ
jgi:hypothetical protein